MIKRFTDWVSGVVDSAVRKAVNERIENLVNEAVRNQTANGLDYSALAEELHEREALNYRELAKHVDASEVAQNIDTNDIESRILDEIDNDEIASKVLEDINLDYSEIEIDYSNIEIDYEELGRALVQLATTRR